jgi:hypothetical protein
MLNESHKVTKTNFFTNESNVKTQAEEQLVDLNESMISCKIDPQQWQKELERVQNDLLTFYVKQDKDNPDPISICLKQAKEAKETISKEMMSKMNKIIEDISYTTYNISLKENRMNSK